MGAEQDLRELCVAIEKAVVALRNHSAAASQQEVSANWDAAKDAWKRFDLEANSLTSFAALIASRYPPSPDKTQEEGK